MKFQAGTVLERINYNEEIQIRSMWWDVSYIIF